jgi:hypothetical protein
MVKTAIITAWFVGITIMFCLSARADEYDNARQRITESVVKGMKMCVIESEYTERCIRNVLEHYRDMMNSIDEMEREDI